MEAVWHNLLSTTIDERSENIVDVRNDSKATARLISGMRSRLSSETIIFHKVARVPKATTQRVVGMRLLCLTRVAGTPSL